jgi:hypothetical protein
MMNRAYVSRALRNAPEQDVATEHDVVELVRHFHKEETARLEDSETFPRGEKRIRQMFEDVMSVNDVNRRSSER